MPELHLRQPGFVYRAYAPFTKHCERIQIFRKTSDLKHIYKNELDKAYFVNDAAYSGSKDLAKRTILDTILRDMAYEIAINPKYDGYQRELASMVDKIFDKKIGSGTTNKKRSNLNWMLAQELQTNDQKIQKKKSVCEV